MAGENMTDFQIVASVLVRDENIYIDRVVRNIQKFCDKIIITDHNSIDGTFEICKNLSREFPNIEVKRIDLLEESFEAIKPYCGTKTWIFAVDGDEIFDPVGLAEMRRRLLKSEFSEYWTIFANTLHCIKLDLEANMAWGYLAPPARAGARLYNFSIINDWLNRGERLLGDNILFKDGYHIGLRKYLHKETDWEDAYFRYVHVSFLPRSTRQKASFLKTRLNANEVERINMQKTALKRFYINFKMNILRMLSRDWKSQKYKQGMVVEKNVASFFAE